MKLGIFLPEIDPHHGGAYTFVETVVSGLLAAHAQDTVTIFHYGSAGDLASRFPVATHALASTTVGRIAKKAWFQHVAARLQRPLHLAANVFGKSLPYPAGSPLDHAARACGIDLMLFPTPMSEPVDVPYVVTVWDLEHRLHPYFPELGAQGEWQARDHYYADALRRATYVITGTTVGRDEIARFYTVDPTRIRILPHPTPAFALDAPTSPLSVDVPRPYVFYPAQFWSHKNHVGLLAAIAELARRNVPMHCAIVGSDKGNRAHVQRRAEELGITDRIHFLGFVERADLVALYRNAYALAYASLCGPENLPPLEAMALGCPVINSDIPGAREQLGDAALLVDTLDAKAFADAIERIPTVRSELVAHGHTRATRYTQTEFGRDLQLLIDDFRRRRNLWT
ncbi:MAG: glycosyltransferase family 4 protein [Myxococcota bacterium]|nr:glycosyltransferase family 4 protein [Myxococcota bacterium]